MKKITQRLLVFFIGLPLLIALVLLLPHYNHLAFNLLALVVSALGAVEFSTLLAQKKLSVSKPEAAILGALPPLAMILIINLDLNILLLPALVTAVISWFLVSHIFSSGEVLDNFINRLAAGFAVLLYPGMFMAWLVGMSRWGTCASILIFIFLAAVFCNDGAAWAAGKLFGRKNQGIIPVSPKKSVAGFIGGTLLSITIGAAAALLFPDIFVPRYGSILGIRPFTGGVLGFLTGIAAVFGDLGESAIKRSSGIKDSGNIIPGRGGVLDSIDSLALAAPVFYLAFCLFFIQP